MKTAAEIRTAFLDYFKRNGHTIVTSSPVVPQNDPTLLFTNAGMNQFKAVFLGEEKRPYTRATSVQKCARAGGKHNDLENVGRTARHHTFFEMLGNFSFGDYFKKEAIDFAWEFITAELGIDPARLWVSVYEEDDEAYTLWENMPGLLPGRIVRLGMKDNFWSMGDTGPCGPCSEIHIDQGAAAGCGRPECALGCNCDRFLELWNLVFMQYNRDTSGALTPLPRPSIDTGMGLERVTAVIQGVSSNYDSDLFRPLISSIETISAKNYGKNTDHDVSIRVIADHTRAAAFLIADGVLPSNEGRGYVLRRIMRRAMRHGKLLEISKPFLHETVRVVADQMREAYPEVQRSLDFITKAVLNEEQAFSATLESGLKILADEMARLKASGEQRIAGDTVFKLYDTYGFPVDLTRDIAAEQGLDLDTEGFEAAMQAQKTRARKAWKGSGDEAVAGVYRELAQQGLHGAFTGYAACDLKTKIVKVLILGSEVSEAVSGANVHLIAADTPFYGESGGQVGDAGEIIGPDFKVTITDTVKPVGDLIVHVGEVVSGTVKPGTEALFQVDAARRQAIACNHTATHILQAVLRECLGSHVKQAGSLVTPQRLRFDFSHFEALGDEQLRDIETQVNERIRANAPVATEQMSQQDAVGRGATALFGEKYADHVRVVSVSDFSMELCGGTHVRAAGEIGLFKIVSESAVAAGVRRIEAVTGAGAFDYVAAQEEQLRRAAELLKADPSGVVEKIERLQEHTRALEREIESLKSRLIAGQAANILDTVREVGGVRVLGAIVDESDPKALRSYGDSLRERLGSGIIVIGAKTADGAQLVCMVTPDLTQRFSAGAIIRQIAPLIDGRGGGKPEMAQAGGKNAEGLQQALQAALGIIEQTA
ncbi:MAG: alanine--tRNA ligase [Deltaproteobacteria bacterium]|nr:alanine--tRNA ligase [Deltaproteobacteria bacterium]